MSTVFTTHTPSATAEKYLKYGYVNMQPFEPGQRYRSRKGMEQTLQGYRDLRRNLRAVTEEVDTQRMRSKSVYYGYEHRTSLRNSVLGFSTMKGAGNQWIYRFEPFGTNDFSGLGRNLEYNPGLPMLYRYYGRRRVQT